MLFSQRHSSKCRSDVPDRSLVVSGMTRLCAAVVLTLSLAPAVRAAPGDLDTSFDGDGIVFTDFCQYDYASAIAIQRDGKIVVAGSAAGCGLNTSFALARYDANGSLDRTFGRNGKVTTDFDVSRDRDYAQALAIQPNGKIVVAGETHGHNIPYSHLALVRYNADGSLDTDFGTNGKTTTTFGGWVSAIALQPNGKIVVAVTTGSDFALARYTPRGHLDTTFGTRGKVITDLSGHGSTDWAAALALQADGKIVVAGHSNANGPHNDFALVRYNPDGSLDTTFGAQGKVTTDFSGHGSADWASALALQADGKIVVAGGSNVDDPEGNAHFALARYHTDGTLDTTFGAAGTVTTEVRPRIRRSKDSGSALVIQPDHKIVVIGNTAGGEHHDIALARYHADGRLDDTFHRDGKVTTNFVLDSYGRGSRDFAYAAAIQKTDGRIVVAGNVGGFSFALARYHAFACGGGDVTLLGTSRSDTLIGTSGPDVISGLNGHDTLSGGDGDDVICGGGGNDQLFGDSGHDVLRGGVGTDDRCDGGADDGDVAAPSCETMSNVP